MKALILSLCLLACGCSIAEMGKAMKAGRTVVNAAEPCFVAQQQAQLETCDHDPPCEREVKEAWKPVADALDEFRALWCKVDDSECGPEPVELPPPPPKVDPKDAKPPAPPPPVEKPASSEPVS